MSYRSYARTLIQLSWLFSCYFFICYYLDSSSKYLFSIFFDSFIYFNLALVIRYFI